ncbi:Dipeptidyl aminopeptidase/acylaminoacyl peptidase [Microbacterium sp. cf046]|uniref:S9 family peptidase n=1 Tax=Microbacterium sp. cf046 TaxID=1761803 RepID=UPI0008F31F81|nr:prolyl oligopeptidase family serine peptidase [Microbacterium sp. cf046]SFR90477.1 Dipeptidyl aminopeptidase/acylaminoacyl peptidase [Microbacterium sp. cf046]
MTVAHTDPDADVIAARFAAPRLLTVRPVVGSADLALLIEDHPEGSRARVWRAGEEPTALLPFPVGVGSVLTGDGRWVVDLDDGGGSEVGSLVATSVDGTEVVDLTPGREPFVLRGLEASFDGSAVVATVVDEAGFHVLVIPAAPWGEPRVVYSNPVEAWYGQISPDGALVSVDTTEHNPGVRRPALTIIDTRSLETVAVLDDLPEGPVRGVRFSSVIGDDRVLVSTERSGFARPAIWGVRTGDRIDFDLPGLRGEVMPLDWHAPTGRVLALHVEDGVHRLLVLDEQDGSSQVVLEGGSFADPDVADLHPFQWASYFAPDGEVRAVRSSWAIPLHIAGLAVDGSVRSLVAPGATPPGVPFTSAMVESADGTRVQVWLGLPAGREPIGTVLEVHGGPNLVAVDAYDPSAQAWIDAGFAYASLNYRGSVTFGRAFREGFWGSGGDREIEDVAAAVGWLRGRGLADPASTFITGASFGGHLTLLSVGRLPDLFAGGLAHVAVAEWSAAIAAMNPAVRTVWSTWVPPEMVERFSAVTYVDDVRASVWINQGSIDTRTPIVGVQRFVDDLAARGGDVVMDVFQGGHEPTGLAMLEHTQRRMADLALRAIRGEAWSDAAASSTSDDL